MLELLQVVSAIDTIYTKLCQLEIENKENTEEYKLYLDYLDIARNEEKKEYREISKSELKKAVNTETSFVFGRPKERRYARINTLLECENSDRVQMIVTEIMHTLMCTFLSIIEDKKEQNIFSKENLCKIKYNTIFISPYIEQNAIELNFKMNKNSLLIVESDDLPIPIDEIRNEVIEKLFNALASKILSKNYEEGGIEQINDLVMIEACLILLDEKVIINRKNAFNELEDFDIDKNKFNYIKQLFDEYKTNKEKHKINILKI